MTTERSQFQFPLHSAAVGADVAQAQSILVDLGLFIAPIELREQRFGPTTADAVAQWQERHGQQPAGGVLDLDALGLLQEDGRTLPRVVHGIVSLPDGMPVPGLLVLAIDRDFRAEQVLGESRTDEQGRYRITYRAADATRAEKGTADVGIRVYGPDDETLLRAP